MEHVPYFLCIGFIALFLILPTWVWIQLTERVARRDYAKAKEAGRHEPVTILPLIDLSTCMGSGACVKACPEDVLTILDGQAVAVNAAACVGHGVCAVVCPVDAIQLVFGSDKRGIDIPEVGPDFQTNVKGLFVAGELGGMGLIANAVEQGAQAMKNAAKSVTKGKHEHDVIIVGAGPAGIAAGLVARDRGLKYAMLEQSVFGGAIRHYPRKKLVFMRPINFPAYGRVKLSSMRKEDLVGLLEDVVRKGQLEVTEHTRVDGIEPKTGGGFVVSAGDRRFETSRVIIAVGRRGTPRKLDVPGEGDEKVAYALLEPELYQNDHVLVVGGGDSAVEAAMSLGEQDGNRVWLSYRRDKINRPKEKNIAKLREAVRAQQVELLLKSKVTRIGVDRVVLEQEGEEIVLPNDFVFVFAGGVLPTKFLKKAGIRIQRHFGKRVEEHVDEVALTKRRGPVDASPKEGTETKEIPPPEPPLPEPPPARQPIGANDGPTQPTDLEDTVDPDIARQGARPGAPIPDEDTMPPEGDRDTAPRPAPGPPLPSPGFKPLPHIPRSESTQPIPLTRKPTPGAMDSGSHAVPPGVGPEGTRPIPPMEPTPPLGPEGTRPIPPAPRPSGSPAPNRSVRPLPIAAGTPSQPPMHMPPGRLVSNLAEPRPALGADDGQDRTAALRRVQEVRQRLDLEQPEHTNPGRVPDQADAERQVLDPMSGAGLAGVVHTDEALRDDLVPSGEHPLPSGEHDVDQGAHAKVSILEMARRRGKGGDPRGAYRLYVRALRKAAERKAFADIPDLVAEAHTVQSAAERALPAKEVERLRRWLHIVHSQALLSLGRWGEAVGPLRAAIESAEADADPRSLAKWRASLGRAYHRSGQYDEAVLLLDDAVRSGHLADAERSATTRVLADIQLRRGDLPGSEKLWRKALEMARKLGSRHAEARAHRGLANCRVVQGRLVEGAELLAQADDLLVPDGDVRVRAGVLARSVEIDNAMGRFDNALYRGEILLGLAHNSQLNDHLAGSAALLADTLARIGMRAEALDAALEAAQVVEGHDERAINARLSTARVLCDLGAFEDAARVFKDLPELGENVLDDPIAQRLALRARLEGRIDRSRALALATEAMSRPKPMLAIRAAPVRLDAALALLDAGEPAEARNAVKRGLKLLQGTGAYGHKLELLVVMYRCQPDDRVGQALLQTARKILDTLPVRAAEAFAKRDIVKDVLARS